ncbi:double-strand break repair helicase AddA [bacterium]|nr:double-strand break repair helicase AddA [bacterium]
MTEPDPAARDSSDRPEYVAALSGQAQAAHPAHSAWVSANAGSGKTKVLIDRVARLLLSGAAPDEILCVTYTRAAAMEMQARLYQRLGDWCVAAEADLAAQIEALEQATPGSLDPARIGRARELFAQALETPGGLRIETIHAFCARLLKRFPIEAGCPPGFQELDEREADLLWRDALDEVAERIAAGDEDLAAAATFVAEVAGAALRPLEALTSRRGQVSAWLAEASSIDDAIARLAAEHGAGDETAEEMLERFMGRDLPRADLRRAADALMSGAKTDKTAAEKLLVALSDAPAAERWDAYQGVVLTTTGDLRKSAATKGTASAHPFINDLFSTAPPTGRETGRILAFRADLRIRRTFERSAALTRLAAAALDIYAKRKAERGLLDFDDLIDTALRLLDNPGDGAWVLWKLDGRLSHVLLDEAQDTSPAQWRLLRRLTEEFFAGAGAHDGAPRTLFVVGDQKQSIYSFQGAEPERFGAEREDLRRRLESHSAPLAHPSLDMSFRSAPEILSFVDTAFLTDAFDGQDPFSIAPPPEADLMRHTAYRRGECGSVELWPPHRPAEAPASRPWDAPLDQEPESSPRQVLAAAIARFVREEIDAGAAVWDAGRKRAMRPGDVLILVRKRSGGLFDAILHHLKRQGLPVAGADRIALLDTLGVQDLLNLIRFVLHPDDDLVLAEILVGPFGGFDYDADLFPLAHGRGAALLLDRLRASPAQKARPAVAFLDRLLEMRGAAPYDFLATVLDQAAPSRSPDVVMSGWQAILSRLGAPAREPVIALLDRAARFDSGSPASLQMFLTEITRDGGEIKRELSEAGDAVRVMTVHGAKGLEAPVVILPDTTSNKAPTSAGVYLTETGAPVWSSGKKEETKLVETLRTEAEAKALREQRRLLYVALTRARDRLVICGHWTGKRDGAGEDAACWLGVCRAAMVRLQAEGRALPEPSDQGEILRYGTRSLASREDPEALEGAALPHWLERLSDAPAAPALPPRAPSSRETPTGAARTREAANPFMERASPGARRGVLIHRLLETLPDLPPDARPDAARAWLAARDDLDDAAREDIAAAALGVLYDRRFAALFNAPGRAEAPIIGGADPGQAEGASPGGGLMFGRVDRLVVTDDAVWIVDFKSDLDPPADATGVAAPYIAQMAAYRSILRQTWTDRPVRALLIFTEGPTPVELSDHDLARAVNLA